MPAHDPNGADGADDPSPDPALGTPSPNNRSLSFPSVLSNNGLSEDDGLEGYRVVAAIVSAFKRLRADQTDVGHRVRYAKHAEITPAQAGMVLEAFFEGSLEGGVTDALKGIHVREAFLARYADCAHDGLTDVSGAGFDRIEAEALPWQPMCICLVVWLSLSAEALARVAEYTCQLIDPLAVDVVEWGTANLEMVVHSEAARSDMPTRTIVIARIGGPVLMEAGQYSCRLSIGDHEIVSVPFTVGLRESSRQHVALAG